MSQATLLSLGGGGGIGSSDVTASRAQLLTGYRTITTDSGDEVVEGTLPRHGGATVSPSLSQQTVNCSGHYMTGNIVVNQISPTMGGQTVSPSLSQQTVNCSGHYMTGNIVVNQISPTMGGQTITPTTSAQTVNCSGHYMTGNITVKAKPDNIWNPTEGAVYVG